VLSRHARTAAGTVFLALVAWCGLIYFGFCPSRVGFLSDEEKIDSAIRDALYGYPPPLASHRNTPPRDLIPYGSVQEFRRVNPKCCVLSKSARGAPDVSFWSRVQGMNSTYVLVDYLVRYRDERGNVVSEHGATFAAITNCGDAWAGYGHGARFWVFAWLRGSPDVPRC
jgi:hypothetical protein